MTIAPSGRPAVSPYARRLARERGLTLDRITGSGPGGRIIATDIDAFVAQASVEPPFSERPAAPTPAAFGASIDLGSLRALLEMLPEAGAAVDLEDVMLRAALHAMNETGAADIPAEAVVALERHHERSEVVVKAVAGETFGRLRQRLATAEAGGEHASDAAMLALLVMNDHGAIRPLMMPLVADRPLRLMVMASDRSAECILTFDPAKIDEPSAAEFLGSFKTSLETPLRLLV